MSESRGVAMVGADTLPLYARLMSTLKEEILAGIFPVGSSLPTEISLCQRFSVSRHTVREALRRLREEGLVVSRRGAGTVVLAPDRSAADIDQVMSISDLLTFANDARFVVKSLAMVTFDEGLATRAGLDPGGEWLAVSGIRHSNSDGRPLCWTEYYIHRNYAAVGRLLRRHRGPIFPLLEDMFGLSVDEVEQQISATLIGEDLAEGLLATAGEAALEVRRSYKAGDAGVVQVTLNTHPASRFRHRMTIRRLKV